MRRVTEVIDCWYDSGAMPFAQWGWPHQNQAPFAEQFPADFISEALDQTRGWFYSLLAISTLLGTDEQVDFPVHKFPHPFKNCIVLGLMLGEDGQKMSKSKRNYREPNEIFEKYGADALRWYFFANQAPWTSIRYSERAIKDSIPEFLLRLWNVYSFFVIYANIDGFDPAEALGDTTHVGQVTPDRLAGATGYRPADQRSELDRWVLSELQRTVKSVTDKMDAYDNFTACGALNDFVDGLSNWFVRRSRNRFWSEDKSDQDKLDAYWTLYECLVTTTKLVAPFTPFMAESLWQNLAGIFLGHAPESVHVCDYPVADESVIDDTLSEQMRLAREISSLGRSARMNAKLKVRQPLSKVEVILAQDTHQAWLQSHASLIADELNVKQVELTKDADQYITYEVKPNFKLLGKLLGKNMPAVKKLLGEADGAQLLSELESSGRIALTLGGGEEVSLTREQIEIGIKAKEGWAAVQGKQCVVVLATELTPELVREGLARDIVRIVQDRRKELDLNYADRIDVAVVTSDQVLQQAVTENTAYIQDETLAVSLTGEPLPETKPIEMMVGDFLAKLFVSPVLSSQTT
jgi:isoleucyl-tRNA synthetase